MKTIKKWIYKFQYIIIGFLAFTTNVSFMYAGRLVERESLYSVLFHVIGFAALILLTTLQFNDGYNIANKARNEERSFWLSRIDMLEKENSRLRNKTSEDNKNENKNSW